MKVRPKRRLGQNFLKDERYLARIISSAEVSEGDIVLEIGAGTGELTRFLIDRADQVIAIEIDADLIPILEGRFSSPSKLHLLHADALKLDWVNLIRGIDSCRKAKLVSNIPYYITAPLIEKAIESRSALSLCVLTVQKEVALRICASPGGREYGSLSIMVQYHADVERLFDIPPGAFRPSPEVSSSVIRIRFREEPRVKVKDERLFFRIVRAAFQQRRKMIVNALRSLGLDRRRLEETLKRADIPPESRPEMLSLEKFGRLADRMAEHV